MVIVRGHERIWLKPGKDSQLRTGGESRLKQSVDVAVLMEPVLRGAKAGCFRTVAVRELGRADE